MSKFYVWIDNPSTQIETSEEFASESQRLVGYVANTKISSKIMNTILRQTSLVTVALMEALGISDNIDGSSSVEEVKNEILDKLIRIPKIVDDVLSLTSENPVENKVITASIFDEQKDLKLVFSVTAGQTVTIKSTAGAKSFAWSDGIVDFAPITYPYARTFETAGTYTCIVKGNITGVANEWLSGQPLIYANKFFIATNAYASTKLVEVISDKNGTGVFGFLSTQTLKKFTSTATNFVVGQSGFAGTSLEEVWFPNITSPFGNSSGGAVEMLNLSTLRAVYVPKGLRAQIIAQEQYAPYSDKIVEILVDEVEVGNKSAVTSNAVALALEDKLDKVEPIGETGAWASFYGYSAAAVSTFANGMIKGQVAAQSYTVAIRTTGGALYVGNGTVDGHAVNIGNINSWIKTPVELTGTNGTLTTAQRNKLTNSPACMINLDGEYYRLSSKSDTELVYIHIGNTIKKITVTIETRAWVQAISTINLF